MKSHVMADRCKSICEAADVTQKDKSQELQKVFNATWGSCKEDKGRKNYTIGCWRDYLLNTINIILGCYFYAYLSQ